MSHAAEVTEVMKLVRQQTILHVGIIGDESKATELLQGNEMVESVRKGDGHLVVTLKKIETDYSELAKLIVNSDMGLVKFREEEIDLESAFMALTKGTGDNF